MEKGVDRAELKVFNDLRNPITVWTQISECIQCPPVERLFINVRQENSTILNTKYKNLVQIRGENGIDAICTFPLTRYNDQAIYELHIIKNNSNLACRLETLDNGRNNCWPIFAAVLILIGIHILYYLLKCVFHVKNEKENEESEKAKKRLHSLDAFRGLTIMLMIFVNYGGGKYYFFNHAPWFGFTFADTVFPFFIFIMGIGISISLKSQLRRLGGSGKLMIVLILKRSLKLFFIGLALNSHYSNLRILRIPGVLQYFAFSYFIVATFRLISIKLKEQRDVNEETNEKKCFSRNLILNLPELSAYGVILTIYFLVTFLLRYDSNCPVGYQGPGGLHHNGTFFNCTGGAANYLDRVILGNAHLYQHATSKKVYFHKMAHDPEGILGATTATLLTGLGLIVGIILRGLRKPRARVLAWVGMAALLCGINFPLIIMDVIPVVKNLWSLSFILLAASLGCITFTIFYILIDWSKIWNQGKPFCYPGKNAIILYIGHEVLAPLIPFYYWVPENSHAFLLFRAVFATFLWWLISYLLARRNIIITV